MSTSLKEREIQERALVYLTDYYKNCSHNKKILAELEVTTLQNKRADGLIIWENSPNDVRVVSIEAKSAKTISSLRTRWDEPKLVNWNRRISELVLFVGVCIPILFIKDRVSPTPMILASFFLLLFFLRKFILPFLQKLFTPLFQTASVIEQVAQYPGNEVWIAIGANTFKTKKEERLKELLLQCSIHKLGLIEVPIEAAAKPTVLLQPKFFPALYSNDFLSFYKKEAQFRRTIQGGPIAVFNRWRYSEAERRYNRINLYVASVIGLFLCVVSFVDWKPRSNTTLDTFTLEADILPKTETAEKLMPIDTFPKIKVPVLVAEQEAVVLAETTIYIPPVIETEKRVVPTTCSFPYRGKKYILKDQLVTSKVVAEKRVQTLMDAGCPNAGYFWLPCSNYSKEELWCVYAYHPRSHSEKIEMSEKRYKYIMRRAGLDYEDIEIWYLGEALN